MIFVDDIVLVDEIRLGVNFGEMCQWEIAQLALFLSIIMGWRLRSWVQDPLGVCVSY